MTAGRTSTVVVGLGNPYRRDDGVGVAVAAALGDLALPNVAVTAGVADPMGLVEAWSGAGLAIVIDAAAATPPAPGRVRRCTLADLRAGRDGCSSHGVDVGRAHELAQALGRAPDKLVVLAIEVADTGHGAGLTPLVSRAVPEAVRLALAEIGAEITRADAGT
ncbi:MAG: hydrogenase maturation protease [Mycobacterium sp.]|uniref:hydrogenase maturation protease n=1 Tax=Mycobacterium sp. TaxID=1785 RepID=UPI0028520DB0|nr:hydrogenase maturation protease [Mycobacterium sp.]HKI39407.1 hydrogenase maturation protease [Mycobacterium sp.]